MGNPFGRNTVIALTNKSGGSVAAGDFVYIDTTNNDSFTTGTTSAYTKGIGIAQQTIASNAVGLVLIDGYAALVNVNASVTRGNFLKSHTVVKQGTDAGASRIAGTCGMFLTGGTTPDAIIWQPDLGAGSGLSDPMTTRGDVIVRDSSNTTARLGRGAANTVLTSDGTDLSYALPGMVQLAQQVRGTDGTITFSSISGSYSHLLIVGTCRTDRANANDYLALRFNSDTGSNYDDYKWDTAGNGVNNAVNRLTAAYVTGDSATAGRAGSFQIWIPDYARTTFHKNVTGTSVSANNPNAAAYGGLWRNTAAITTIDLLPEVGTNFKTGSVATLYGIK
jgi:hypothetical protein